MSPSPDVLSLYRRFDHRLHKVAAELLGVELTPLDASTDLWLRQGTLPVKWGGLGLGDLSTTPPMAHLGCWAQVRPLLATRFPIDGAPALACAFEDSSARLFPFQEAIHSTFAQLPPPVQALFSDFHALGFASTSFSTAALAAAVWDGAFNDLVSDLAISDDIARLCSVSSPAAGAWLQALPHISRTAFGNSEFLSALRLRLGLADPAWTGLSCLCSQAVPSLEDVLRCGVGSPGRISVHHALRDVVATVAAQAGYQVSIEPVGHLPLRRGDSSGRHPDVAIFDRGRGTWRLLDVTDCSPLSLGALPLAATTTGATAAQAEARKRQDYADAPSNKPVVPLAVELYGCLGVEFHSFLTDCAHRVTARSGQVPDIEDPAYSRPYFMALQHFREWIACTLQRSQSLSLGERLAPPSSGGCGHGGGSSSFSR